MANKVSMQIWVSDGPSLDDMGAPIEGAKIDVFEPDFPAPEDATTNSDGFWSTSVDAGRKYNVEVHADGYGSVSRQLSPPTDGTTGRFLLPKKETPGPGPGPGPNPPSSDFGRIELQGNQIKLNGREFFMKGTDGFLLLQWALEKGLDSIDPFLDQMQAAPLFANMIRWWTMCVNVSANEFGWKALSPQNYPEYWNMAPRVLDKLRRRKLWSYLGIFPDVQLINGSADWQNAHWDQWKNIIQDRDELFAVEFQNEAASKSFNCVSPGFRIGGFNRPWCGTSYSTDDPAYSSGTIPQRDMGGPLGDLHATRSSYTGQILDSTAVNNIYYKSNKGLIQGEGDRLGWRGRHDPRYAGLIGNACRVGNVGTVFHSMRGERCELFDPETMQDATAYFGALNGPIS